MICMTDQGEHQHHVGVLIGNLKGAVIGDETPETQEAEACTTITTLDQ